MSIRAVIVDDEPIARDVLQLMLASHARIEVVGSCKGGREAIACIRQQRPDLLFLDVQMPETDGFAVLEEVGFDAVPLLVFVTAYDHYAIKAFEAEALDYLLKPFDQTRFDRTMARVSKRWQRQCHQERESLVRPPSPIPVLGKRLVLRDAGKIELLKQDDIIYVQAAGDYVQVHLPERKLLVHQTLRALCQRLDPQHFVQIHRSFAVNLQRVISLAPVVNGDYRLLLEDGTQLKLSRTYKDVVLKKLGID